MNCFFFNQKTPRKQATPKQVVQKKKRPTSKRARKRIQEAFGTDSSEEEPDTDSKYNLKSIYKR